jgi:PAS domain S-box-containing protein
MIDGTNTMHDTPVILIVEPCLNLFKWLKAPIRRHVSLARIVHTAVTGECAKLIENIKPDLVIFDCSDPENGCLAVLKSVHETKLNVQMLAVVGHENESFAVEASKLGVARCILKSPDYLQTVQDAVIQQLESIRHKFQTAEPHSYYRELVENASECIYLLDDVGHIRLVNRAAARLTSYAQKELVGKHFSEFFAKTEYDKALRNFERGKRLRPPTHFRTHILTKSNESIPVELNVIPVEKDGTKIGYQGIVRDIREQVQAENERARRSEEIERMNKELVEKNEELLELNKVKTQFLSAISHELRTPLNAILGYAELLREELYGKLNEAQTNALGNIIDGGDHLLKLINELLDFSRIHKGKFRLYRESHPMRDIVEAAAATIRPAVAEKKLNLIESLEKDLPILFIDAQKIYQAILNLLSNAIKFTDSGEVELSVYRNGNFLEFAVRDTGIGIASEDMDRIFEDFHQVDGSVSRTYGGAGLGLSLAKHLIQLHGGEIWVQSSLGEGSTFSFNLPMDQKIDSVDDETDQIRQKAEVPESSMIDAKDIIA